MEQVRAFPSRRQVHGDLNKSPAPDVSDGPAPTFPSRSDVVHKRPRPKPKDERFPPYAIAIALLLVVAVLVGGFFFSKEGAPDVRDITHPLDPVRVAGRQGGSPVVTVVEPVSVEDTEYELRLRGSGREIVEGSPVLLAVSAYDGRHGTNLRETGAPALIVGTADEGSIGATLADVVVGQPEGSRLVIARLLSSGETEINVVDILYSIARGAPGANTDGPLTVTATEDGITVVPGGGDPPSDLTVQVLIDGFGPQVSPGDQVVAQYLAVAWSDGSIISSTWDAGAPRTVELSTAMPGLREALVDRRVGSRLAITIPPEKATGEGTMAIVVDILGTVPQIGTDSEHE